MVKFECCSDGLASEVKSFLNARGFKARALSNAVVTDMPSEYKGSLCNAMIKVGELNEGDLVLDLDGD